MGQDFCNETERRRIAALFKTRELDIKPLYTYICPVIIFVCFFSIIFNAILMSISRQSKFVNKSPILLLSLNLAVTDLIASLLNGLGILFNSYLPEVFDIKMSACTMLTFESIRCAALIASALHLLALAFVHYRGIVNPLHYRSTIFFSQHLSRTVNIISICCWIIPLTIMIAWFSSTPCQGFQTAECDYLFLLGFTYRYMVLSVFSLPLLLMSIIYVRIFLIINRHQKGRRLEHERSTLTRGVVSASGTIGTAAASVNLPELMVGLPGEPADRCPVCLGDRGRRALSPGGTGGIEADGNGDDQDEDYYYYEDDREGDAGGDGDDDDDEAESENNERRPGHDSEREQSISILSEEIETSEPDDDDDEAGQCERTTLIAHRADQVPSGQAGAANGGDRFANQRTTTTGNDEGDSSLFLPPAAANGGQNESNNKTNNSNSNPSSARRARLAAKLVAEAIPLADDRGARSSPTGTTATSKPATVARSRRAKRNRSHERTSPRADEEGQQQQHLHVGSNGSSGRRGEKLRAKLSLGSREASGPLVASGDQVAGDSLRDGPGVRSPDGGGGGGGTVTVQNECDMNLNKKKGELLQSLDGPTVLPPGSQAARRRPKQKLRLCSSSLTRQLSSTSSDTNNNNNNNNNTNGTSLVPLEKCTCDNKLRHNPVSTRTTTIKLSRANTIGFNDKGSRQRQEQQKRATSTTTSLRWSLNRPKVALVSVSGGENGGSSISSDFAATGGGGGGGGATAATTTTTATDATDGMTLPVRLQLKRSPTSPASGDAYTAADQVVLGDTTSVQSSIRASGKHSKMATPSQGAVSASSPSSHEPQRRHVHASAVPQTNTKALVTTLLILGTYFISYVPAIIFQVLTCVDYCPYPLYTLPYGRRIFLGSLTTLLLIVKTIVDPLIYSYRTNEIQMAISRYLSKRRSKTSSHATSLQTSQRFTFGGGDRGNTGAGGGGGFGGETTHCNTTTQYNMSTASSSFKILTNHNSQRHHFTRAGNGHSTTTTTTTANSRKLDHNKNESKDQSVGCGGGGVNRESIGRQEIIELVRRNEQSKCNGQAELVAVSYKAQSMGNNNKNSNIPESDPASVTTVIEAKQLQEQHQQQKPSLMG